MTNKRGIKKSKQTRSFRRQFMADLEMYKKRRNEINGGKKNKKKEI